MVKVVGRLKTLFVEELASHGAVVVATEHPGGALRVAYDSGHNVDYDPAEFGAELDDVAYEQAIRSLGRTWAAEAERMLQALRAGEVAPHLQHLVNTRTLVTTGHSTGVRWQ